MCTPHQEPEINSIAALGQKQCLRNKYFIQRVARWCNSKTFCHIFVVLFLAYKAKIFPLNIICYLHPFI